MQAVAVNLVVRNFCYFVSETRTYTFDAESEKELLE